MIDVSDEETQHSSIDLSDYNPKQLICNSQQLNNIVYIDHDLFITLNDTQQYKLQNVQQQVPYQMIRYKSFYSQYNIQTFPAYNTQIENFDPQFIQQLDNISTKYLNISFSKPSIQYYMVQLPDTQYLKLQGKIYNTNFFCRKLKKLKVCGDSYITSQQLKYFLMNNDQLEDIQINIKGCLPVDENLKLDNLKRIKFVSIDSNGYTLTLQNVIKFCKSAKNVEKLVCYCNVSCTDQQIVDVIQNLKQLKTLEIYQTYKRQSHHQYQKDIELLYSVKYDIKLQDLTINGCQISDKFITYLSVTGLLNTLQNLTLENLDQITDKGLLENFASIQQQYKLQYKSPQIINKTSSDYGAVFQLALDNVSEYLVPDAYNTEQNCVQLEYFKLYNCCQISQIQYILYQTNIKVFITDIQLQLYMVNYICENNKNIIFIFPQDHQFSKQQVLDDNIIFQ